MLSELDAQALLALALGRREELLRPCDEAPRLRRRLEDVAAAVRDERVCRESELLELRQARNAMKAGRGGVEV